MRWRACAFNNVSEAASKSQLGMTAPSCPVWGSCLFVCLSCAPSTVTTADLPLLRGADVWLNFHQQMLNFSDYFCVSHQRTQCCTFSGSNFLTFIFLKVILMWELRLTYQYVSVHRTAARLHPRAVKD